VSDEQERRRVKGTFVGDKFEPLPLDIAILSLLPVEGTKKGQYLWDAPRVGELVKKLGGGGLTSNNVGGRIRLLRAHGLVVEKPVLGSNRGLGWQRTDAGTLFFMGHRSEM
jgi:hypothetical protein